jgi:hypothetical protein
MVKKGTWVSIKKTLLEADQRTGRLPDETRKVPFVMWSKGTLTADAELGAKVTVTTRTGRTEEGILEACEPHWELGYGNFIPELLRIGDDARAMLFGGGTDG